jgi:hypothetical protein
VVVRCSPVTASGCAQEGKDQQISPAAVESNLTMPDALTPEVVERLRESARANGTYFGAGQCPTSLAGDLVFLENPTVCRFGSSGTVWNQKGKPGVVIIGSGSFYFEHARLYALVYHVNGSDGVGAPVASGTPAITIKNNGTIEGQVIIDGNGELEVGNNSGGSSSIGNVIYDANVVNNLKAFGTAGIVQNSFREIYATGGGY